MARAEFPRAIKVACVKRATRGNAVYCEECNQQAKGWQIDHVNPDGLTGKPTLENARLLCKPCHSEKTKADVEAIARAKRVEAKHLGVATPTRNPIPAPAPREKAPKASKMTSTKPAVVDRGSLFARYCQKDASQ